MEQKCLEKQESFKKKIIAVEKINTKDQKANICTKPLPAKRFAELTDMMFLIWLKSYNWFIFLENMI